MYHTEIVKGSNQDNTSHDETETFAIKGSLLWNEVSWNRGEGQNEINIRIVQCTEPSSPPGNIENCQNYLLTG